MSVFGGGITCVTHKTKYGRDDNYKCNEKPSKRNKTTKKQDESKNNDKPSNEKKDANDADPEMERPSYSQATQDFLHRIPTGSRKRTRRQTPTGLEVGTPKGNQPKRGTATSSKSGGKAPTQNTSAVIKPNKEIITDGGFSSDDSIEFPVHKHKKQKVASKKKIVTVNIKPSGKKRKEPEEDADERALQATLAQPTSADPIVSADDADLAASVDEASVEEDERTRHLRPPKRQKNLAEVDLSGVYQPTKPDSRNEPPCPGCIDEQACQRRKADDPDFQCTWDEQGYVTFVTGKNFCTQHRPHDRNCTVHKGQGPAEHTEHCFLCKKYIREWTPEQWVDIRCKTCDREFYPAPCEEKDPDGVREVCFRCEPCQEVVAISDQEVSIGDYSEARCHRRCLSCELHICGWQTNTPCQCPTKCIDRSRPETWPDATGYIPMGNGATIATTPDYDPTQVRNKITFPCMFVLVESGTVLPIVC